MVLLMTMLSTAVSCIIQALSPRPWICGRAWCSVRRRCRLYTATQARPCLLFWVRLHRQFQHQGFPRYFWC